MVSAYLDIETTGLSIRTATPTIVGVLAEDTFKQFIYGIDLTGENIDCFFIEHKVTKVVGYNLIKFDIPFLCENPNTECQIFDILEIKDLMNICHSYSITGGLKATEKRLGIIRDVEPLNFFQQKALWKRWVEKRDQDALQRYLKYNEDDVRNLKLVEQVLPEYIKERSKRNQEIIEKITKDLNNK